MKQGRTVLGAALSLSVFFFAVAPAANAYSMSSSQPSTPSWGNYSLPDFSNFNSPKSLSDLISPFENFMKSMEATPIALPQLNNVQSGVSVPSQIDPLYYFNQLSAWVNRETGINISSLPNIVMGLIGWLANIIIHGLQWLIASFRH